MPIDFFSTSCDNQVGNCQNRTTQCLVSFSNDTFGVSDANADLRMPAFIMFNNPSDWDLTIENKDNREVKYKAIDFCIDIYRTGSYDVYNDNSSIADFSSDSNSTDKYMIKRCEGLLFKENEWILFFEIKNRLKGNWLIDARRKFEETILSFKEHHPNLRHLIIAPIVSNKLFNRAHQSEMTQKRILKDKVGVELKIQKVFTIT